MGFLAALVLIAAFCAPAPLAALDRDVRILETDDRGLTVEIMAAAFHIEDCAEKGLSERPWRQVRIRDWARTDRAGSPDLPLKSFLVQVPRTGQVEARILENVEDALPAGRIAPVPERTLREDGSVCETIEEDEGIYGSSGLFPASLVEVGARAVCRGVPLSRITVHPFRWSPASGELRVSRKLRLRLEFAGPLVSGSSGNRQSALAHPEAAAPGGVGQAAFDRFLRGAVLNYLGPERLPSGRERAASTEPAETVPQARAKGATGQAQLLRIEVREEGIYRISHEDLAAAGFDTSSIYPWTLRLYNMGQEVAIQVVCRSGWWRFVPGDYIEFYARGVDTPFTDTNVYWLSVRPGAGKRVAQIDGHVTGQGEPVESFRETMRFQENHTFWEATPGAPQADAWFWEKVTAPASRDYSLELPSAVPDPNGAVVRVAFQGRSTAAPHPNHHTTVALNSARIAEDFWDGDIAYVQEASVPAELVQDGPNTLTLGLPGDSGAPVDIVYPDWFEVEYTRALEALDDALRFSLAATGLVQAEVSNLGGPDVRIYDVTDSLNVKEIVNSSVEAEGEGYRATFEDELNGTKSYLALTAGRTARPAGISCWKPPHLKSSQNGADWLLITPRELVPSTWPLLLLRWSQGLRVRVVSVEDIYNTFSHGLTDPQAIRDFLRCAYESWTPPAPAYVLLLGDASTDYRDFMATGKKSRVPVHLTVTSGLGLTPDDNWYACIDGDDLLPDLFIGRVPAATSQAAAQAVWKTFLYEALPWPVPPGALFAADDNEMTFESLNESLASFLPPGFETDRIYLRLYGSVDDATADILSSLNRGRLIATYTGHGAVTNWAGEYLFESPDVALLDNREHLPFVLTLDCLNGYFSHFSYYCLAEELVAAPFKGAVACFSPSGLGYTWEHEILSRRLFSAIFEGGNRLLGPAAAGSKIAAYGEGASEDLLTTFTLLGDPALSLKAWEE
ncbi:MAG: C25 family cysteine peptidase [bacterium]